MTSEHQPGNPRIGFEKEAISCLDRLYNFAFRITGSERTAYKLLRETYKKALRFYDHLDEIIDFESWMLRIMRNTYRESFGKKKIEDIEYEKIQIRFGQLRKATDINHLNKNFFNKLTGDEISDLLAMLPDDFKMVIVLRNIMGFTYEEIADFTDAPLGIVRSRIHRGRKILFINLYNNETDKIDINADSQRIQEIEINENRDTYYLSALADNEIDTPAQEEKIREAIEKEPGLLFEYKVQDLIKSLITEKLKIFTIAPKIKKKLERKISSASKSIRKKKLS